jgi:hypothetical protein
VVADRGVKAHACIQQRLVGFLEFLLEIVRLSRRIEVVAEHDDEVERELRAPRDHLVGNFLLCLIAAP